MPRKPRVEIQGYHHIINRGIVRGDIFLKEDDFKELVHTNGHLRIVFYKIVVMIY
jgi:hypothetical protein